MRLLRLIMISFIMVLILTGCVVIKQSTPIKPNSAQSQPCSICIQEGVAHCIYHSPYNIQIIKINK
jgi:uncharacterized protein YceK